MKNLFKFSLCAFAALALANCTNDLDEGGMTPPAAEGFTMTINAGVGNEDADDSRTSIVYDGSTYHMAWNTSETQKEYLAIVEVADKTAGPLTKAEQKSGDEKVAVFQTTFPSVSDTGKTYDYLASYPYSESVSFDADGSKVHLTMPAEQTPAADGAVDPNSTLLFASHMGKAESGRPYQIKLGFEHVAAYVKVAFKGLTLGPNESIDRIEFKVNDEETYIAGPCLFDYSNAEQANHTTTVEGEGSNTITLNVSALNLKAGDEESGYLVNDFELYFSALPAMIHDFTVTVVANSGRRYEKNVKTDKGLPFERGVIRTMSISNEGFDTAKQKIYKMVKPSEVVSGKRYLIVSQATTGNQNAYVLKNTGEKGQDLFGDTTEAAGFTTKDETTLLHFDASDYTWTFTGSDTFTISSAGSNLYLTAPKQSADTYVYVPLTLSTDSQAWRVSPYSSSSPDSYRLTIENATYGGDFIATDRSKAGGAFYSVGSNAWTQIFLYEDTGEVDDVNNREYFYYKVANKITAGNDYLITVKYNGNIFILSYTSTTINTPQTIQAAKFENVKDGDTSYTQIKCDNDQSFIFTFEASGTSGTDYILKATNGQYLRYYSGAFSFATFEYQRSVFTLEPSGTTYKLKQATNGYLQIYQSETWNPIIWQCGKDYGNGKSSDIVTFYEKYTPEEGGGNTEDGIPSSAWPLNVYTKVTNKIATNTSDEYVILYNEGIKSYLINNSDLTGAVLAEQSDFYVDENNILTSNTDYIWTVTTDSSYIYILSNGKYWYYGYNASGVTLNTSKGYFDHKYNNGFGFCYFSGSPYFYYNSESDSVGTTTENYNFNLYKKVKTCNDQSEYDALK